MVMSTTTQRKYIGGTRNLDGAITRTVGVVASSPTEAKRLIADRLSRFGPVRPAQVGILRIMDLSPTRYLWEVR
jgi:hypothetical protein